MHDILWHPLAYATCNRKHIEGSAVTPCISLETVLQQYHQLLHQNQCQPATQVTPTHMCHSLCCRVHTRRPSARSSAQQPLRNAQWVRWTYSAERSTHLVRTRCCYHHMAHTSSWACHSLWRWRWPPPIVVNAWQH